jgi:hypothetical protein
MIKNRILRRLKDLIKRRHCSPTAVGWLTVRTNASAKKIELTKNADGRDARGHPAVLLRGLERLQDGAALTMAIDVVERSKLHSYTVSIVGRTRSTGAPFYARIDLDEEPRGEGLCSHPMLHCHVGSDPVANEKLSPRAPLPWLHPADALDWLIATFHPALESK